MIYLDELDKGLLIALAIAIGLGIIFFFLSGLYHIKKDKAIVIEKAGKFIGVYKKGWHFFMPIVYQRRATYLLLPQVVRVKVDEGPVLEVTYKIDDVEKYHYNGIPTEALINRIRRENETITIDILKNKFQEIGLEFISIKRPIQ